MAADRMTRLVYEFTASAAGAWTKDIEHGEINGIIARVTTVPDGTTAPTDNYDVTLVDQDSVDLFFGYGADRDATATESFVPLISQTEDGINFQRCTVAVAAKVTLTVANAGSGGKGKIIIIVER